MTAFDLYKQAATAVQNYDQAEHQGGPGWWLGLAYWQSILEDFVKQTYSPTDTHFAANLHELAQATRTKDRFAPMQVEIVTKDGQSTFVNRAEVVNHDGLMLLEAGDPFGDDAEFVFALGDVKCVNVIF